jgi:Uma2 family endonuclease
MEARPMSQVAILDTEACSVPEPEIGKRYEIIDGQKVEKRPMGNIQILIAATLDQLLGAFVRANRLGRVAPEMLFRIDPKGRKKRAPDVAFVSYARLPRDRKLDSRNGFDVSPELAIEVISPSNTVDEVFVKIRDYFQAGVLRVWIVIPSVRQVHVHESPVKVAILGDGDDLDGGDLVPGFRLSLAELFEDGE